MVDVFISHSKADREHVKPVAERLASLGYSVRWDDVETQRPLDHREQEVDGSRAVLVVWSAHARNAAQVYGEAARAYDQCKLLQARLDGAAPPPPFYALPTTDLSGPGGWGPLEQALVDLVKNGRAAPCPPINLGPMPTIEAAGSPKLVSLATIAVLAAFVSALDSGIAGAIRPEHMGIALVGVLGVAGACAGLCAHRLFSIAAA